MQYGLWQGKAKRRARLHLQQHYTLRHHADWLRTNIPAGARILWIDCPAIALLCSLEPSYGVAVTEESIASDGYDTRSMDTIHAVSSLDAIGATECFDYIITDASFLPYTQAPLSLIAQLKRFHTLHTKWLCYRATWWGAWRMRAYTLPHRTYAALFKAAGYELITTAAGNAICAQSAWAALLHAWVMAIPGFRWLARYELFTLQLQASVSAVHPLSVSIIMPCRNERGSIAPAVARMPLLGSRTELICIEGHSHDDTLQELYRVQAAQEGRSALVMKVMVQSGIGKRNAVVEACAQATGDIIIIFDGDMTLAPEDMVHFYDAVASGRADCANGSRFLLPMESEAMRWPNWCVNQLIAWLISWPLGQQVSDTLCGTKAFWRLHYERSISRNTGLGERRLGEARLWETRLWELDPFGDFAFLLSTAAQSGKILDIPVSYHNRIYGKPLQGCFGYGLQLWRLGIYACLGRFFGWDSRR